MLCVRSVEPYNSVRSTASDTAKLLVNGIEHTNAATLCDAHADTVAGGNKHTAFRIGQSGDPRIGDSAAVDVDGAVTVELFHLFQALLAVTFLFGMFAHVSQHQDDLLVFDHGERFYVLEKLQYGVPLAEI
ncbi:Hypothetical protein UVM_LOCUS471 [uncultured virus]|nr:Hypothetical protein UVM_LOCUS471 [uncultured virus]